MSHCDNLRAARAIEIPGLDSSCERDPCDLPSTGTLADGDQVKVCGPTGEELKTLVIADPCELVQDGELEAGDALSVCGPTGQVSKTFPDPNACDSEGRLGDLLPGENVRICVNGQTEYRSYNPQDLCAASSLGELEEGDEIIVCAEGGGTAKKTAPSSYDPCGAPQGGALLDGDEIKVCTPAGEVTRTFTVPPPSTGDVLSCIPIVIGEPSGPPAEGTGPLRLDCDNNLWVWACDSGTWTKTKASFGDLEALDPDTVTDICNQLKLPVSFTEGDCEMTRNITLNELSEEIQGCICATIPTPAGNATAAISCEGGVLVERPIPPICDQLLDTILTPGVADSGVVQTIYIDAAGVCRRGVVEQPVGALSLRTASFLHGGTESTSAGVTTMNYAAGTARELRDPHGLLQFVGGQTIRFVEDGVINISCQNQPQEDNTEGRGRIEWSDYGPSSSQFPNYETFGHLPTQELVVFSVHRKVFAGTSFQVTYQNTNGGDSIFGEISLSFTADSLS